MDITYVPMARGFVYLAAVIDWFSRKILAWRLSITLSADFCIEALEEALCRHSNERQRDVDHVPVVMIFNPVGTGTWLISGMEPDGDTLFGLADLGFGYPELGSCSLAELASVRLPVSSGTSSSRVPFLCRSIPRRRGRRAASWRVSACSRQPRPPCGTGDDLSRSIGLVL